MESGEKKEEPWKVKNREKWNSYMREYSKKYRAENAEKVNARKRLARKRDPEFRQKAENYRIKNRDRINNYTRNVRGLDKSGVNKKNRESYERVKFNFSRRFKMMESRSKKKGFLLAIDKNLHMEFLHKPCFYCCKSLLLETGIGLDRIDNSQGYSQENVLPCCGVCNRIRGNHLTVDEAKIAISAVMENRRLRGVPVPVGSSAKEIEK